MPYLSERQFGFLSRQQFLYKLKNSSSIAKSLKLDYTLNVHQGCVNTVWWNDQGTTILSGSDDQNLIVTDAFTQQVLSKVHSGHRENIFSAKFLPETNDRRVVSCSGDGVIFHTNFDRPPASHSTDGCFLCHGSATAYEVRVIPQTPNLFLSCSDDCTVRLYDLRTKSNCIKEHCKDDILIKSCWPITSMDINSMNSNEIVCACSDGSVRLYDHRKLSMQDSSLINGLISYFSLSDRKESRASRITSVVFNRHGTEILASYSSESVYLLDPKRSYSQQQMKDILVEHRKKKENKRKTSENKSTTDSESPTARIKRLRLQGDWSDTGPDSHPSNEEQTETNSTQNPQNFWMQRMSDILTQLVTRTADETDENHVEETSTGLPTEITTSSDTNTTHESEDTSEPQHNDIFDLIFRNSQNVRTDVEEYNDNNSESTDDEDEDESAAAAGSPFRRFIPTKWERLRQRRESERSQEESLLKNIPSLGLLNSYDGHRNARTMIKEANFWSDSFVMSGSDCGNLFIWDKFTGDIVRIIPADGHVVNCVQPHPHNYPILATSGIDYNIKIFSPISEHPIDDSERINATVKRNYAMSEETSSTITVPASFLFRMLRSIHHLRQAHDHSGLDDSDDE